MAISDKKYITKIKEALSSNQIVIGLNNVMKLIKTGQLSEVYYCKNCPDKVINELSYYRSLSNSFKLEEIPLSSIEFGIMCKKQFMISIIGIIK